MLETLISSRIRRALFEHLLAQPDARFYLRGLAKQLGLSVSPLRRELKRLEHSGMLKVVPEGNMVFYQVDPASPGFLQLQQVGQSHKADAAAQLATKAPSPVAPSGLRALGSGLGEVALSPEPPAPGGAIPGGAIPVGVISVGRRIPVWRSPLSHPALIGAAGAGIALILVVAGLLSVTVTQQRLASQASRALATRRTEVTVVVPPVASSSGAMRGSRWQIVPGGFGGFSSGASDDSY